MKLGHVAIAWSEWFPPAVIMPMLIKANNSIDYSTVDDCYPILICYLFIDGIQLQVRFLTLMEAIIRLQLILRSWSDAVCIILSYI